MPTEHQRLRLTLDALHEELARTDDLSIDDRERLEGALADIQSALDKKLTDDERPSIGERLGEAARHFEGSHPTLSGTLGSVIDALGRMGI